MDMDYSLMPPEEPLWFTSMGMFIIDHNKYPSSWNKKPEHDIIGGALTYAVVGARMIATNENGRYISGIIDKGNDFPEPIETEINSWGTGLIFRTDNTRKTTKGVNEYLENGIRDFYYETPKKRIEVIDILQYDKLLHSKSFHLICSIARCKEIIQVLSSNLPSHLSRPIIIWEPYPADCTVENYQALCDLLPQIDIFTPNLIEAQNFINKTDKELATEQISKFSETFFMPYLTKQNAGIVLRCGKRGCFVKSNDSSKGQMIPAYHTDQNLVKDPTGGGNSFCGGFIIGFLLSKNWIVSSICGNLVSGCIIEQLGMPQLSDKNTWNGLSMKERLNRYIEKYPHLSEIAKIINWL